MPCPFLSRLPGTFIKNYTTPLLKMYADQCPVISRAVSINKGPHYQQELASAFLNSDAGAEQTSVNAKDSVRNATKECPFLKEIGQDGAKQLVKSSSNTEIFEERSKGDNKGCKNLNI